VAARSIASVFLTFGLVSIPVKVYSATQSSAGISFNLLHRADGSRLKQQYLCAKENVPVERSEMIKGYEFAKDQYVTFTAEELKALEENGTQTIDIIAFIPTAAVDPIYYDKAYYLAPDKGGTRPYSLLIQGMRETGRCALAKWPWKGKQYMVQIRAAEGGLVLQQLLYADEVRSMKELEIELAEVKKTELDLAKQLIDQIAQDRYDAAAYEDEVKKRIEAAVNQKVEGKEMVVSPEPETGGAQVIDLMEALRASLARAPAPELKERKPAKHIDPAAGTAATRTKAKKSS
jgi:DNA end-binding protein Ku